MRPQCGLASPRLERMSLLEKSTQYVPIERVHTVETMENSILI